MIFVLASRHFSERRKSKVLFLRWTILQVPALRYQGCERLLYVGMILSLTERPRLRIKLK
jgi:hypothetical protein